MAKVDGPTTGDELPDSDGPATTGAAAELEGAGGVGGGGDPTSDGEGRGCSLFSSVQLETDTLWQSAASTQVSKIAIWVVKWAGPFKPKTFLRSLKNV